LFQVLIRLIDHHIDTERKYKVVGVQKYSRLPLKVDPSTIPVVGVSSEPAIALADLTPQRLRDSFKVKTDWVPESSDEQDYRAFEMLAPKPASVLIPLIQRDTGLTMLLTRRTAHLSNHAGQVSFPGGRAEPHDRSPIDTALRETEEEIGLARQHIEPIGHLPDYFTNSGYRVTPIVSLVLPPFELLPDSFEVAEVFEVPLEFLMNPANHQTRMAELEDGVRSFYTMPYGRHFIWGATASMLRIFYSYLAAHLPRA
jgi:8-oxo-dGTP pyrophosphatase MutT (NUDIX family)